MLVGMNTAFVLGPTEPRPGWCCPLLLPALLGAAVGDTGDTAAARTAGAWDLLWELQDLSCPWGLGSKFTSYDFKKKQAKAG